MACPLARPYGGTSISDDTRRARSGPPGQRSDQQPAKESARVLSTLPHAARSAAPSVTALDHLPPTLGSRRSLPWSIPGNEGERGQKTMTLAPLLDAPPIIRFHAAFAFALRRRGSCTHFASTSINGDAREKLSFHVSSAPSSSTCSPSATANLVRAWPVPARTRRNGYVRSKLLTFPPDDLRRRGGRRHLRRRGDVRLFTARGQPARQGAGTRLGVRLADRSRGVSV
jgi:hypothetical protein